MTEQNREATSRGKKLTKSNITKNKSTNNHVSLGYRSKNECLAHARGPARHAHLALAAVSLASLAVAQLASPRHRAARLASTHARSPRRWRGGAARRAALEGTMDFSAVGAGVGVGRSGLGSQGWGGVQD